jgi:hypothetical protein
MNYIKKFENFKFLDIKEIILNIKDLLIDIEDVGLDYQIYPTNDIKLKMISLKFQNLLDEKENDSRVDPLEIEIFNIEYDENVDVIINTIKKIKSYLNYLNLEITISVSYLSNERSYMDIEGLKEELTSSYIDTINILIHT